MSKELEALEAIENAYPANPIEALKSLEPIGSVCHEEDISAKEMHYKEYNTIKQALQRLEAIENAKPSEALKSLEYICKILNEKRIDVKWLFKNDYNIIKQYILKAQEQDFNYNEIVLPFLNKLVVILGINDIDEMLDKIKKQEKVLEILKEKNVDIDFLKSADTFEEYNKLIKVKSAFAIELTQEEFDTLKRWIR